MKRKKNAGAEKKTKKQIAHAALIKLLYLLYFLVTGAGFLILFAVFWIRAHWGNIEFSTIVFQMSTPMKGSDLQLVFSFILGPLLYTALILTGLILLLRWMKKCGVYFRFPKQKKDGKLKNKVLKPAVMGGMTALSVGLGILGAWNIGAFEYLELISKPTALYDKYYVDPKTVEITFPEKKKNLIMIYMESMETTLASREQGGDMDKCYIPELMDLALDEENISFSNTRFLGGGYETTGTDYTVGALFSSSSGVPLIFKNGDRNDEAASADLFFPGITMLGDILDEQGYKQVFMCGSDASYAGRNKLFEQHGNYRVMDFITACEQGYYKEEDKVFWGHDDRVLYERAKDELLELSSDSSQPFNFTMLTVDTHFPNGYVCEVCDDQYENSYLNVYACASRQLGEFVSWIKEQDFYENTTIIITGDHLNMANDELFMDLDKDYHRCIYNCFINTGIDRSQVCVKGRSFSDMDYFPTILSALGVDVKGERLGLGVNLFANKKTLMEKLGEENVFIELLKHSKMYDSFNEAVTEAAAGK